jgi:hypothetical protein
VELAVAGVERTAGEKGETGLAAEGGAHERRRLVRRESQENLLDKILEQCWWRCRRRHGRLRRLRVFRLGEKRLRRTVRWRACHGRMVSA